MDIVDLVVSCRVDNLLKSSCVPSQISDHRVVHAIINVSKPSFPCKHISYCKYCSVDIAQFKEDSEMVLMSLFLNMLVCLRICLISMPLKSPVDRTMVFWYTDTTSEVKCLKRKLEKQMKRTGLSPASQNTTYTECVHRVVDDNKEI